MMINKGKPTKVIEKPGTCHIGHEERHMTSRMIESEVLQYKAAPNEWEKKRKNAGE
jgi:hypothetical protein